MEMRQGSGGGQVGGGTGGRQDRQEAGQAGGGIRRDSQLSGLGAGLASHQGRGLDGRIAERWEERTDRLPGEWK